MIRLILLVSVLFIFLALPLSLIGQINGEINGENGEINGENGVPQITQLYNPLPGVDSIGKLIALLAEFVRNLVFALTPLAIIIGAWYILTAGGDANKVNTGKKIIFFSLGGLAVVIVADALYGIIADFLE